MGDLIFELPRFFLVSLPVGIVTEWDRNISPVADVYTLHKDPVRDVLILTVTPKPGRRDECMLACAPIYDALQSFRRRTKSASN